MTTKHESSRTMADETDWRNTTHDLGKRKRTKGRYNYRHRERGDASQGEKSKGRGTQEAPRRLIWDEKNKKKKEAPEYKRTPHKMMKGKEKKKKREWINKEIKKIQGIILKKKTRGKNTEVRKWHDPRKHKIRKGTI